ncbi:GAF domain-containing protein [Nocardia spumae]|uniref:GAF domain-containing protein n=1 Tax=Nocardia spumae TaxID=2887190 RepID=UPI001D15D175|nr:GAF domain-containing protein [Nocardia spumae]
MILGHWLLIETLDVPATWSVIAVDTVPRRWKSLARTVPARLMPILTAAAAGGETVERQLPKSRYAWSGHHACAIAVTGPDDRVHAVQMWVGPGRAPAPPPVAAHLLDARTRRTEVRPAGLGPAFDRQRTVWVGAESFEHVERFDDSLDLTATVARAEPGSRWSGELCVRTPDGLRTLLMATRNSTADPHLWRGVLADITDSVAPRPKSFEAVTVDTLVSRNPGMYLAVLDTQRVRVIRWISAPVPGLDWTGGTDERELPHPAERTRIIEARNAIRAGRTSVSLPGLRLAATDGSWLTADVEVSPLPYGPDGSGVPHFALARIDLRDP